jgi:hypothetical protein
MFHRDINNQARVLLGIVLFLLFFSLFKLNPVHAQSYGTNIGVCADDPANAAPFANVDYPDHPIIFYSVYGPNPFDQYQIKIYRVSDNQLMHDTGAQCALPGCANAGNCTWDYPVPPGVLPADNSQYKYTVRIRNTPQHDWTSFAEGYFYLYKDGECGILDGQSFCPGVISSSSPVKELCKNFQSSPVTVSGGTSVSDPWTWVCKSLASGGGDAYCQASVDESLPGIAGTELNRTICPPDTISHVGTDLCSRYDTDFPPIVSGPLAGPWSWTCSNTCNDGSGSGTLYTRSMSTLADAVCGSASGKNYCDKDSEPDRTNLCVSGTGTPSNFVENYSEWTWTCTGQCGGTPVDCRAGNIRSCGWTETSP